MPSWPVTCGKLKNKAFECGLNPAGDPSFYQWLKPHAICTILISAAGKRAAQINYEKCIAFPAYDDYNEIHWR
jgi:hypothetical protein